MGKMASAVAFIVKRLGTVLCFLHVKTIEGCFYTGPLNMKGQRSTYDSGGVFGLDAVGRLLLSLSETLFCCF